MASPTTAAAPDAPSGSSPLSTNGLPRLVGWFVEIVNFIKALSPSGSPVFDTTWVDCTPAGAASSYTGFCKARRWGMLVEVRFDYSVIPSSAANSYTTLANLAANVPRPANTARGTALCGGGSPADVHAYVTTAGAIAFVNTSGSARTAVAGTVMYLAG